MLTQLRTLAHIGRNLRLCFADGRESVKSDLAAMRGKTFSWYRSDLAAMRDLRSL